MAEENRESFDDTSLEGIDPEWIRVVQEYESRLGLLPMNNSLEMLLSYYDDLGADVLIAAIRKTAKDRPERSFSYLKAILESFIRAGITTREEAEENIRGFEEKRRLREERQAKETSAEDNREVRWF